MVSLTVVRRSDSVKTDSFRLVSKTEDTKREEEGGVRQC